MNVIDAHTGRENLKPGDCVPLPLSGSTPESSLARFRSGQREPYYRVITIRPGLFSAAMTADIVENGRATRRTFPPKVRWLHPGFLFQHVAFVPS